MFSSRIDPKQKSLFSLKTHVKIDSVRSRQSIMLYEYFPCKRAGHIQGITSEIFYAVLEIVKPRTVSVNFLKMQISI